MTKMEGMNSVRLRVEDIMKQPDDPCSYRRLILCNGMRVLLISDPRFDVSGVALSVNAGYINDPDNLPGLAHLCEHAIYLGVNELRPYELMSYVNNNEGLANASTTYDTTVHRFIIKSAGFQSSLNKMLPVFLEPQFNQSTIAHEVHSIDSEYMIRAMTNGMFGEWFLQFLRSSTDNSHPYSKFPSGNKETLDTIPRRENINVTNELVAYYEKYYSSNIMCLCVYSKENLDVLESMIAKPFSLIKNKNVIPERCFWRPFFKKRLRTKWYVVPPIEIKELVIIFALKDELDYDKYKPATYICYLLNQKQEGSLLSILKEYCWCISLVSEVTRYGFGVMFLSIIATLTEEGVRRVDDIIAIIFQYIRTVKPYLDDEASYEDYDYICSCTWKDIPSTIPHVLDLLARKMHMCPTREAIKAELHEPKCDPKRVKSIIENHLTPELIRVYVVAKMYEIVATESEKWYGTKYKRERIPDDIIDKWKTDYIGKEKFKHPIKNTFIPCEPCCSTDTELSRGAPMLLNTDITEFWYKEIKGAEPMMCFEFTSSISAAGRNLTNMFVLLLEDSITEYAYPARLTGLKCEFKSSIYGITLTISGFSTRIYELFIRVIEKVFDLKIDPRRFELLKQKYIGQLREQVSGRPINLATNFLESLLTTKLLPSWYLLHLTEANHDLTIEAIERFISQFLRDMQIYCSIEGDVNRDEFTYIVNVIWDRLRSRTQVDLAATRHKGFPRHIRIHDGSHFLLETETKYQKTSCTLIYYQTETTSVRCRKLLNILCQAISEYKYDILRADEQLGYDIRVEIAKMYGSYGLAIAVVGHRYETKYVEERIDDYLEFMLDTLQSAEFKSYLLRIIKSYPHSVEQLATEAASYYEFSEMWEEIASQEYNFHREENDAQSRKIEHSDVIEYYRRLIAPDSRRKVSIYVKSRIQPPTTIVRDVEDTNAERIIDMLWFKFNRPLSSRPRQNVDLEPYELNGEFNGTDDQ